ncbi:MAG: NUDIX hydrolase [Clostridia bacterium]|nr:NUDIX hydrolase [Clostridia bacterium]
MNLKEKQLSSDKIYSGRIISLFNDKIELPDKREAYREYVKHPGGICVVPVTDDNEVLLVRQYRYPYGEEVVEIPAGKRDSREEDTLIGGKRELKEELGITADRFVFLGEFYPTPGYTDEVIYMYAAFGLHFGAPSPDDDEFVLPEKYHIDTLVDMILKGEIKDGKTQAAVLKTKILLDKKSL